MTEKIQPNDEDFAKVLAASRAQKIFKLVAYVKSGAIDSQPVTWDDAFKERKSLKILHPDTIFQIERI